MQRDSFPPKDVTSHRDTTSEKNSGATNDFPTTERSQNLPQILGKFGKEKPLLTETCGDKAAINPIGT